MNPDAPTPVAPAAPAVLPRLAAVLAIGSALAFVAALATRPVSDRDIGYHLAYGERFLQTGHIVDSSDFLYGLDPRTPPGLRHPAGPGNWYDAAGHYRFPNANWLSQVVMALLYRAGGMTGLSVFAAILITALAGIGIWFMCRMGVPPPLAAAATVLVGLASYERFSFRPELLGYLILMLQLAVLAPVAAGNAPLSRRQAGVLVALQLLGVNLHSYFILGLALTGAVLADRLLRWFYLALASPEDSKAPAQAARLLKGLALLLALQALVCLANPWTWRLAVLPFQTLQYLGEHQITQSTLTDHPWSRIIELFPTFDSRFLQAPGTLAFRVVLALAAAGALAMLWLRRWSWLLITAGLALTAIQTRRNIGVGALTLVPLSAAALWSVLARLPAGPRWLRPSLQAGAALLVAAAAGTLGGQVVTERFYASSAEMRFGLGASPLNLPLGAAEWINRHQPAGTLWADFDSSSNICFLTRPHRDVPTLTNTWACPPALFAHSVALMQGQLPFEPFSRRHDVRLVLIRTITNPASAAGGMTLLRTLAAQPDWRIVHLDPLHVLLLRTDALPNPPPPLLPSPLVPADAPPAAWFAEFLQRAESADPIPAESLWAAGRTCQILGWHNEAIELLRRCLRLDPARSGAWMQLGISYVHRLDARRASDRPAALKDWSAACDAFRQAHRLGQPAAARNLQVVESRAP